MFVGTFEHSLDEKGRVVLPQTFRAQLVDKGFLSQVNEDRPFRYRPTRSFEDVSRSLLGDLIERVFRGSREQLLIRLIEQKSLTAEERALIEATIREEDGR